MSEDLFEPPEEFTEKESEEDTGSIDLETEDI